MKRLFFGAALALALTLALSACGPKAPSGDLPANSAGSSADVSASQSATEDEPFVFTRDNLPRLDGATSTAPLAQAMCAVLLGEDEIAQGLCSLKNMATGEQQLLTPQEAAKVILDAVNADIPVIVEK